MSFVTSTLLKGALAAAVVGGSMMASAASADVACNRWHECWHVHDRLAYPGVPRVVVHGDSWRHHGYHWRQDRTDRGYYRNGVWITF